MTTNKSKSQKRKVIEELRQLQSEFNYRVDSILIDLCPECPECCPPQPPCSPGEVIEEPDMIVSCERCYGRGYLFPDDE